MGVGQHFNQAAYIGKYFSYLPQKPAVIGDYRTYDIEVLKLEDLFNLNHPTQQDILNIIKPKPSFKLFSSGAIISKESEKDNDVNGTEKVFKILDKEVLFIGTICDISFADYFALHEARSISNFLTIRKGLYNGIFKQNKSSINGLKEILNCLELVRDSKVKTEINQKIEEAVTKGENDFIHFEKFSREVFNLVYPFVWRNKKYSYCNNRNWITTELADGDSLCFGTTPIIDFESGNHSNIGNLNLFQQLPKDLQYILKNSVVIIEKKNSISIGMNTSSKQNKKLFDSFKTDIKKLTEYLTLLVNFLSFFALLTSYKYLVFTSQKDKAVTVESLQKMFNDLKLHYEKNITNATINGKFKY